MNIDQKLTCAIHDLSRKSRIVDAIAVFIAKELSFAIVAAPMAFIYFVEGNEGLAIWMTLAIASAVGFQYIIQGVVSRKRPYQTESLKPLFRLRINTKSFPSGHATMLGMTSFVTWWIVSSPWVVGFVIIGTVLVLLSRVYAGLHYISDILAGLLLSALIAYAWLGLFLIIR